MIQRHNALTQRAPTNMPPPAQKRDKDRAPTVPDKILDTERNITYQRGRFLGKGGFAHCYELINMSNNQVFAGKIVPKTMLIKQYQRDKMAQEVQIHRALSHSNVVKLFHFFEDKYNVYITLELCNRRSLLELHKRRKAVTEPEARYFTHQVVTAVDYLHDLKIIHRDLKLGNLFLNDALQVKIGDFGLATTIEDDERKKTLCGTPNYIAPEVLNKDGHSFEVDIWAIGCILYTLLFAHPPFESKSLQQTYDRIKKNQYIIPSNSSPQAARLIRVLLAPTPNQRPTAKIIVRHEFFKSGYMPTRLPVSCLTMVPKFGHEHSFIEDQNLPPTMQPQGHPGGLGTDQRHLQNGTQMRQMEAAAAQAASDLNRLPEDAYLADLYSQVTQLLSSNIQILDEQEALLDDYQSPEALPIFWVSKWVDYSDKYGIGYQFCDNSVGVLFNDNSRIMLDEAGNELTYIEKNLREHYFQMSTNVIPPTLTKKVTLLKYFRSYMNDHLMKAGEGVQRQEGDDLARLPTLRVWFRTKSAIVLHLSSGTVQINFFNDHIKMMMCPLMQAVTFIDQQKRILTYKFSNLATNGCPEKFISRLKYAKTMIERLMSNCTSTKPGSLSTDSRTRSASASARVPASSTTVQASGQIGSKFGRP
ncbi:unnamed protein product [Caenorhabditis auriculariae]|uniref:Serine/threonine-protein kinase PLK n=1 Tax=Caenorhabditis auriculariae TaxID=2777116 RepID=A0A8S1GSH0_9PELO|nr:unnamed protein product [Caenorhabditis auriculariae]